MACSVCGKDGHNSATCPDAKHCSYCGSPEHNVRRCPNARFCRKCGEIGHYAPTCTAVAPGGLLANVRYETESGWPSRLDSLLKRIGAYTREDRVSQWKVGISAYPERRAEQHDRSGVGYDEMVVIYVTRSIANARVVERWVTEEFDGYLDNERQGGGGLVAEAEAHFVYLLLRR